VVYEALGDTLRMDFTFLELWLGMVSLELWLGMTSLELWLRIADEHEESLSYGSDWRVLPV